MQQITVDAIDENLSAVNDFIHQTVASFNPSDAVMLKVDLAVEELFVNIAHYAYAPETGSVTIGCSVTESPATLCISLTDSGMPGGMGIFLTKQYMDDISYNYTEGKNTITIQKKL